jgi:hypothetical protein
MEEKYTLCRICSSRYKGGFCSDTLRLSFAHCTPVPPTATHKQKRPYQHPWIQKSGNVSFYSKLFSLHRFNTRFQCKSILSIMQEPYPKTNVRSMISLCCPWQLLEPEGNTTISSIENSDWKMKKCTERALGKPESYLFIITWDVMSLTYTATCAYIVRSLSPPSRVRPFR